MPRSVKKSDVVRWLHAEQYNVVAKQGSKVVRHLKSILDGPDFQLAAKAAYVAGMINSAQSARVVELAAKSRKPVVRVSAANAARHLDPELAEPILKRLLKSRDVGVRKSAIRSSRQATSSVCAMLDRIKAQDTDRRLRKLAGKSFKEAVKQQLS